LILRAVLVLLLLPTSLLEAQTAQPLEQTAEIWRTVRQPGYPRAQVLLRHAKSFLARADEEQRPHRRAALIESAIVRLERAVELLPEDPELRFFHARALSVFERPATTRSPAERRDAEAIAAYALLRELDAAYEPEVVGFELGILYTRQGEYERAIAEYEQSIRYSMSEGLRAITYANLAEVLMMQGDLLASIAAYEEAIRLAQRSSGMQPRSLMLALWGASVALDRLGEHRAAIERAQQALSVGAGTMAVLRSDGVFFEPASEIHFYEGLGHMAAAELAEGRERIASLRRASRSWRRYLYLSEEGDPWRSLAERHAAEVHAVLHPSSDGDS